MANTTMSRAKKAERAAEVLQRRKDDEEREHSPREPLRDRLLDKYLDHCHRMPAPKRLKLLERVRELGSAVR